MIDPIEYDAAATPVLPEERERFTITDDAQATWAMRKLVALRKRQVEIDALAREEIARIEAWHINASASLVSDTNFFTGLLTEYARRERDQGRKSISLPYGTIKSRAGSNRIDVTDAGAFIKWARVNAPTLIRVREEPDKAAIKATFDAAADVIVDTATGEVVPGVAISRAETTYAIETD